MRKREDFSLVKSFNCDFGNLNIFKKTKDAYFLGCESGVIVTNLLFTIIHSFDYVNVTSIATLSDNLVLVGGDEGRIDFFSIN